MSGQRILLVDDEETIRKLVSVALGRRGFTVETVADGARALEAAQRQPPDLLITDITLPGIDGLDLVDRLRADSRFSRTPIIVLSGRDRVEDVLTGYQRGADEYVTKPIEVAVLVAKVEALLRRYQAGGEAPAGPSGPAATALAAAAAAGRVAAFVHGKGGVGTTTLAVCSALALAGQDLRVSLLDLDSGSNSAATLLELHPPRTLADLARAGEKMDSEGFEAYLGRHPSSLALVSAAHRPEQGEAVTPEAVRVALGRLKGFSDCVLVDLPNVASERMATVLDTADLALVVTSSQLPALRATTRWLQLVDEAGFPAERTVVVLNQTTPLRADTYQVSLELGRPLEIVVSYSDQLQEVGALGGAPLASASWVQAAGRELGQLVQRLNTLVRKGV